VPERGSPVVTAEPGPGAARSLPARNRRTAAGLVIWIVSLMLLSVLVAWLRN
jgi:hypothetical protein